MSAEVPRALAEHPSALPPGTRLAEFELRGVLGIGGFGIVYLAFDHVLEREVAVKEYMPAAFAGRTATMHVSLRSQSDADIFALGMSSFEKEAKLLARFDHPSLLKVHRFWKANGTAYMVMPVMRGRTVKELRQEMLQPPTEAWLRRLLDPLLEAIERLHAQGLYHRDIAPDNIQIEPDGNPVLLDFGAARWVISEVTQTLTAILKPAYAPIEQYAEVGSVRQGPWTDLYSLGATLHYLLLGRPPPPATARTVHDDVSGLTTQALPNLSENFLLTVDWMLAPRPADRPQSIAALREVLAGRASPPRRKPPVAAPASPWEQTVWLPAAPVAPGTPVPALPGAADPFGLTLPLESLPAPPAASPEPGRRDAGDVPDAAAASFWPPLDKSELAAPPVDVALASPPAARRRSFVTWGAGAAVIAAGIAVVALRGGIGPLTGAGPAASMTAASEAHEASAATTTLAPAVAASSVRSVPVAEPTLPAAGTLRPESRVATVVLPGSRAAHEGVETGTGAGTEARAGGSSPAQARTAARHASASAPHASAALAAPAGAATADSPPATALSGLAPEAAPNHAQPGAVLAAVQKPAASAAASTPEGLCANLDVFRHFVCMERQCLQSQFSKHPECLAWHHAARND